MSKVSKLTMFLVLATSARVGSVADAQSPLEKLEQAVNEALKRPSATKGKQQQGELPAPANRVAPAPAPQLPLVPAPVLGSNTTASPPAPSGYLGLEAEPVLGGGIGVRVASVTDGSPAWKAGFKTGDVVLGIDGHAIADLDGMVERLAKRFPGESVKFLVSRGGRNLELSAVLQDTAIASRIQGSINLGAQPAGEATLDPNAPAWLGLAVSDLSPAFRSQFGISAYRGAAVTDVVVGSPAELAQIKPGDAIVEINGRAIDSAQDVLALVAQSRPGQAVELLVFRGSAPRQKHIVLGVDPKIAAARSAGFFPANPFQAQPGQPVPPTNAIPGVDLPQEIRALREELRKNREQLNNLERRMDQLLDLISQPGK